MTYVHSTKKNGKVNLDKGFEITKDDKKRAVAVDYVIDTDKRGKDGSTGKEPKMTE